MMRDQMLRWFCGDEDAVEFGLRLWTAAQEWDDLHDEGQCANSNALLSWLAFGKEATPFFMRHAHVLRPAMLTMYLQWRAANVLERGSRADVDKAFMLRAGIYTVFVTIAWLVGGDDWAAEIGPEIYRTYGETPDGLWKEMQDA